MTRDERALLWLLGGIVVLKAIETGKRAYEEFRGDPVADEDDPRRFGNTRVYDWRPPAGAKLP